MNSVSSPGVSRITWFCPAAEMITVFNGMPTEPSPAE